MPHKWQLRAGIGCIGSSHALSVVHKRQLHQTIAMQGQTPQEEMSRKQRPCRQSRADKGCAGINCTGRVHVGRSRALATVDATG
ncbi:hypothetical protein GW17_00039430 [Ensete ventricosum]|nr:hypothetical protein GW17_00039430 [Ensete ventricosum]